MVIGCCQYNNDQLKCPKIRQNIKTRMQNKLLAFVTIVVIGEMIAPAFKHISDFQATARPIRYNTVRELNVN